MKIDFLVFLYVS